MTNRKIRHIIKKRETIDGRSLQSKYDNRLRSANARRLFFSVFVGECYNHKYNRNNNRNHTAKQYAALNQFRPSYIIHKASPVSGSRINRLSSKVSLKINISCLPIYVNLQKYILNRLTNHIILHIIKKRETIDGRSLKMLFEITAQVGS